MAKDTPIFVTYDERYRDASFEWMKDPELLRLIRGRPVTRDQQLAWFAELPARRDYLIYGVELGGRPIGACGLKHVTANDAEYWGYIADPSARGKGFGRWMVEACFAWARELHLTSLWLRVGVDNPIATNLYRSLGFAETSRTAEEIVMTRTL